MDHKDQWMLILAFSQALAYRFPTQKAANSQQSFSERMDSDSENR